MAPSAPRDADTLDGGRGSDTLSYKARTRPVTVRMGGDLDAGDAGEHDRAIGIEDAVGGAASDRLIGNRQANSLSGLGGDDLLDGGDGRNYLSGGRGRDRLFGRRSADLIIGAPSTDILSRGGGRDRLDVFGQRVDELLPRGCEELLFVWSPEAELWVHARPSRTRDGGLALRMQCPYFTEIDVECRGDVVIRETRGRHRLLARGAFSDKGDSPSFSARLSVTSVGSRWAVGRLGSGSASVVVHERSDYTPRRPFTWRIGA